MRKKKKSIKKSARISHVPSWMVLSLTLLFQPLGWYFMYKDRHHHRLFAFILVVNAIINIVLFGLLTLFVIPLLSDLSQTFNLDYPQTSVLLLYAILILSIIQVAYGWYLRGHIKKNGELPILQRPLTFFFLGVSVLAPSMLVPSIIDPLYHILSAL